MASPTRCRVAFIGTVLIIIGSPAIPLSSVKYRIAEGLEALPLAPRVRGLIPLFGQMLKVEKLSKSEMTKGGLI